MVLLKLIASAPSQQIRTWVIALCLAFTATVSLAQSLPLLPSPASLSGAATTAQFYGGVQLHSDQSFVSTFSSDDEVSVFVEAMPEAAHLGSSGQIFVLASVAGVAFVLNEEGSWGIFDGTVEGLGQASAVTSFSGLNRVDISSVLNLYTEYSVQSAKGEIAYAIHVGYASDAQDGEIYYNVTPLSFTLQIPETDSSQAFALFESNISEPIIQSRCINCHADGGSGRDSGLIFQRRNTASTLNNFAVFESFLQSRIDAPKYILSKASGNEGHAGGVQLPKGGTDYNNMLQFLSSLSLSGSGTGDSGAAHFFAAVTLESNTDTLRRAAIMLAGRAPSKAEIAQVASGGAAELRAVLRNLMSGEGFHEFLLQGANDQLLVRGAANLLPNDAGQFHQYRNRLNEIKLADFAKGFGSDGSNDRARFIFGVDEGLRDSPLELIAYVVENERPYSEILTADYMMLNPLANFAVDGTATFNNEEDMGEFQPGRMNRYYVSGPNTVTEEIVEIQSYRIIDPGDIVFDFPHAGILNTHSFLSRYPTTATNRNRARARWTFMHFLNVDIEKSAPRTTDAVALADTNNPTRFNANCTVCHASMDPVAGAFQNYGDQLNYKNNEGIDSLDHFYKYSEGSLYQHGDTWYRDMRDPGIFDFTAPDSDNSLQWLAQQIVAEPAFARAAVDFWWPAVIGNSPLGLPEVEEDATYQAQLAVYDAQSATIQALADTLTSSGMNLKDMLVEMMMTPWFRAGSVDESQQSATIAAAHELAGLGSETLLTPQRLSQKTLALTGFGWGRFYDGYRDRWNTGLSSTYSLYYGGIDSQAVTTRSREMTPLMSTVAQAHALEVACPIIAREFILPDGYRKLFNGIDDLTTPLTEAVVEYEINTALTPQMSQRSLSVNLTPGSKTISISLLRGFCDWDQDSESCLTQISLLLDSLEIRPPGSTMPVVVQASARSPGTTCGNFQGRDDVRLWGPCSVEFAYNATSSGQYTITANVAALRQGVEHESANQVAISIDVSTPGDAATSQSNGANAIRQKLVELHVTLHGKTYAIDDPIIESVYQFFVASWLERRNLGLEGRILWPWPPVFGESCNWEGDDAFFDGLGFSGVARELMVNENGDSYQGITDEAWQFMLREGDDDVVYIKNSWITVLTYLLTNYDYLYE